MNQESGPYNTLYVLNVQESDVTIYRCRASLKNESYVQLSIIGR